jgi:hypothetical protein
VRAVSVEEGAERDEISSIRRRRAVELQQQPCAYALPVPDDVDLRCAPIRVRHVVAVAEIGDRRIDQLEMLERVEAAGAFALDV